MADPCSVNECEVLAAARGLCRRHYMQARKNNWAGVAGGPDDLRQKSPVAVCSVYGCARKARARGWCAPHYMRWKRDGDPGKADSIRQTTDQPCSVNGCERPTVAVGFCRMHYHRNRRDGETGPVESVKVPRGGFINGAGYRVVYVDKRQVLEHRAVMANALGRPLIKGETVHHKYGDKSDNRLHRLELWSKSQPAGQRVEDKLDWCLEFLGDYLATPAYDGALAERVADLLRRYAPHLLSES